MNQETIRSTLKREVKSALTLCKTKKLDIKLLPIMTTQETLRICESHDSHAAPASFTSCSVSVKLMAFTKLLTCKNARISLNSSDAVNATYQRTHSIVKLLSKRRVIRIVALCFWLPQILSRFLNVKRASPAALKQSIYLN